MRRAQPPLRVAGSAAIAALVAGLLIAVILLAMDRPPICACGTIKFWHGAVNSSENSQHLADWYSFSHVIHGFLFYAAAHFLLRGRARHWALPIAVAVEGFWEILENSPIILNRYREATIALGYAGDSIVNSLADIGWMAFGFWLASRLPAWATIALAIAFELFTLAMIRDNLTLNVLMLVWPVDAIRTWQGG
ncbi:hypothetical protein FHS95_003149 [Sphingomonas naasensis]|uniref:UPF0314 protein E5A74_13365 n=1 Tax=Sphingomonas naasensis TaxID=1344951 RepID=A0A4S1WII6_9SPHN|nr:DUF2585 domain-containing protein [Sphingomonas naasensis]NIJ21446.1 hypothetical protein [Sphingomonas naasensis]TGX41597.1 DUF2585 domain-containing protein [Sphingomonas naasensis]